MDFYQYGDPRWNVDEKDYDLVYGGGSCQWGERIDDGNIDDHIWPRAVSAGEILWSNPSDRTITDELKERINWFTCKLQSVGVDCSPIAPSRPCPGTPGARFE